jgi:hypothetical protein
MTEDFEKIQRHNEILEDRLVSVSLNTELNHVRVPKYVNKKELIRRLEKMMDLGTVITPSILSYPYLLPNQVANKLMPLIFHFDEKSWWPDEVKDKAKIYEKFQENKYPPNVRQTALSAILNAEDNVYLDYLNTIPPANQVTEANKVSSVLFNPNLDPATFLGPQTFADFETDSGLAKIRAYKHAARGYPPVLEAPAFGAPFDPKAAADY